MEFSILTDTSANLPSELLHRHQIFVIPFSYLIGEKEYTCLDTAAFDAEQYYHAMREGTRVTTSQINPQRYIDYMEPLLLQGKELLYIGMSSGISGSYASAESAAAQLREKYPQCKIRLIDTLSASLGEGILVLKAIECRDQGKSLDETADLLEALRHCVCQIFTVDDLMHLRRSGRISNATALVGTVLQIKPLLKGNEEGKIVTFAKIRGRKKAIEAIAEKYDALVDGAEMQTVGIAHAGCHEDAEILANLLRRYKPPREILTVHYEPVTGSHVGPGALALFFIGGSDVRTK
ncbi:MAG: DegV family protein [Clostridiales bacterium]|nr:DegV family protein [Clostridiales bacterium]